MSIKKMFALLVLLIFIYSLFSFLFRKKSFLHEVNYTIKASEIPLEVKEKVTYREGGEKDNYFFEVKTKDSIFSFQIFDFSSYQNYKIQNISYFENEEYRCISPTFKGEDTKMVLCNKENILYPYSTIQGENKEVDAFAKTIYGEDVYIDNKSNFLKKGTLTIYSENLLSNHYLALENYKGIALINSKDIYKNISLFTSDKYTKNMSVFMNDSYLTADYNQKYNFNEFYLVNIKNGKKETIISHNVLNLDGYAMGGIDKNAYFFDKKEKEQYVVSLDKKRVSKVGDTDKGVQIYQNKNFEVIATSLAYQNKITFYEEKIVDSALPFERVDHLYGEKAGIYYFYQKQGNRYHVYSGPSLQTKLYTYLFDTTNIENIVYQDDFIYYIDGKEIRYYSTKTGSKTVLSDTELNYNKSLKFGLFIS